MKKSEKIKKQITNYLYDHYTLKSILKESGAIFIAIFSAALFAFGFVCFTSPWSGGSGTVGTFKIITGGVSGLSQNLALIVSLFGGHLSDFLIEALGYTLFNLPILIFGFFKVGKRFSLYTLINVAATSLFIWLFPKIGLNDAIAGSELLKNSVLTRVIFAAATTGVSSALAFKAEISCGGIDVITYYFSNKKSTNVGKYSIIVNSFIIVLYFILTVSNDGSAWNNALLSALFSITYQIIVATVTDLINRRNKKIMITAFSSNKDLGNILIAHFPHSATRENVSGVYSGEEKYAFIMVVSVHEAGSVISLIRKVDPKSFVTTTPIKQVYGNFFIKPIK